VVTGCGTCKVQLEQGAGVEVRHPIWILRKAYDIGRPEAAQEQGGRSFAVEGGQ